MAVSLLAHAHYAWLVTASLLAGAVNAVASGGSFISFPAMLAMGVAPVQANATNTVAIWPGQLTSVFALRGDLRKDLLTVAVLCAISGGIGGAEILLHTPQSMFLHILPWMILAATVLFLFAGRISAWLKRGASHAHKDRPISMIALTAMLLPVCLYVGYFGAGGGLLIMAALGVLGVEAMHELNSMKVLVACIANLSAVVTFVVSNSVAWHYCLIAMVFAGLGGYVGAHYARRLPAAAMRAMVIAVGFAVSGWFFWVAHTRT
ncbi:sulfite exporter TauE/SafE family protein [Terriglobus roseus]|uniref:Probable membrane transporter protein n=1 Tax=Terriglobus roseus TaxID=392734 RepID=A0A1H4LUX2_9BACT|nr:sulfite exporter TauE/SafE family protein [Terriglobus roseus]SEB74501.1 hypothetical protein SAMN05443244_1724 [Terriglobus roseus]